MRKILKFITSALLASTTLVSLTACQPTELKDTDYDGLTDNIDPDPKNNQYQISVMDERDEGPQETGDLTLTMDYRDFLVTEYKYDLGILGSLLVNEIKSYLPIVKNNVYPKTESSKPIVSSLLTQIGAKDIQMIKISDNTFETDPYDVVDVLMAHHIFKNEDKKYQIFFVVILPYPNEKCWISNFDFGAVNEQGQFTDSYVELEGNTHNEWTNLKEHKGFSVTTNRALKAINEYEETHKEKDSSQITYVTGHSRGGAISNLIGKEFVDKNKQVRAYCFNPANTTLESDEEAKKEAYNSSIFNLINNGDVVSRVPSFGFKLYGTDIKQDINEEKFKEFMKKEYEGNTSESVDEVSEFVDKVFTKDGTPSRNNYYEYRDDDPEFPERWEGTREEMKQLKENLENGSFIPNNSYGKKCFEYSEIKGDDPDCYIEYKTRPAILKALLIEITDKERLTYVVSYLELLDRLLNDLLELFLISGFSPLGIIDGHRHPVACVLALQLKK